MLPAAILAGIISLPGPWSRHDPACCFSNSNRIACSGSSLSWARKRGSKPADLESISRAGPGSAAVQTAAAAQKDYGSKKGELAPEIQESVGSEGPLALSPLTRSAADLGWKRTRRGEVYLPRLQYTRKEGERSSLSLPPGEWK